MWAVRTIIILSLPILHAATVKKSLQETSGECCPGSIMLVARGAEWQRWPKYFGRWDPNPSGEKFNGEKVYINALGNYLYKLENGKWSANTELNERGVLRGVGDEDKESQCLEDITAWKYWEDEEWKTADITVTCGEGEL